MPEFLIIEFTEDNVKDIISSEWLVGRQSCRFPNDRAEEFMKRHVRPNSDTGRTVDWIVHPIRIISSKDTLPAARSRLKKISSDSDGESTDYAKGRRRLPTQRFVEKNEMTAKRRVVPPPSSVDQLPPAENLASTSASGDDKDACEDVDVDAELPSQHANKVTLESLQAQIFRLEERTKANHRSSLKLLTNLTEVVESLERRLASITTQRGVDIELPVSLPVSSLDDFITLDEWLQESENLSNLVKQSSLAGGFRPSETVRRIFNRLIDLDVAVLFSLEGRNGKRAFRSTRLMKVLRDATLMSVNSNEKEIENTIKEILKHAKDKLVQRSHKKTT